jgi:uncharacterized protein YeaO (DUF488 family)
MIGLKRVYDPVGSADGTRLLVERLWPRGVKKTALKIDNWVKDVAPSAEMIQSRSGQMGRVPPPLF